MHTPYLLLRWLALAVLLIGFSSFILSVKAENAVTAVTDRSGQILFKNNRADSGDYPFILEVKLVSETSSELVFDITYFMSDVIGDEYSISVHPDNSSWSYTRNRLKAGIHTIPITVSYHPENSKKTASSSALMYYSIHRFENSVSG